jgi:hypothetical protein
MRALGRANPRDIARLLQIIAVSGSANTRFCCGESGGTLRAKSHKKSKTAEKFRARLRPRPPGEVLVQFDSAYCFHWAWRDACLSSNRNRLTNSVFMVAERRKALEWALKGGSWDDMPLDT